MNQRNILPTMSLKKRGRNLQIQCKCCHDDSGGWGKESVCGEKVNVKMCDNTKT